jgi:RNA polymerase sigma factor (sigma-70 family)
MNRFDSLSEPVSLWLGELKQGDRDRVANLFDHYFSRLVGLAATRLRSKPEMTGYEEDIALSAFKSLCIGVEKGRFPDLSNRDELWRLMAVITVRKAINIQRRKRLAVDGGEDIADVLSREPSPEEVAEMSEQVEELLMKLEDVELRRIAIYRVEGQTNAEIAKRLGCVERTVERKLHQIRMAWSDFAEQ